MTERIAALRRFFVEDRAHHVVRQPARDTQELARTFAQEEVSDVQRAAQRHIRMLALETPVIFPQERLVFTRTNPTLLALFTPQEMDALRRAYTLHEQGEVCNICVDYTRLMDVGLQAAKDNLLQRAQHEHGEKAAYLRLQADILTAILDLAQRYHDLAVQEGRDDIARMLSRVPAHAPSTFPEALQMFRILHFVMWLGGNYHNTIGRFDQFMYPYFAADMRSGRLSRDAALEWIQEFFLTFNRDSDLYFGVQQGDNGQSLMLGGLNPDGTDSSNELTELCLKASLELGLIDPKINLRVHKNTPLSLYRLGSELTRQGLGFPQYANDEVVIPALIRYGYEPADAYNYTVAACWEFIIPGRGMDIPNIGAVSLAGAVQQAVAQELMACDTFEKLLQAVQRNIHEQVHSTLDSLRNVYLFPAPYLSLMMDGYAQAGRDISLGCKYNNYGLHGTGLSTAVDALAAVRAWVYGDGSIAKQQLLNALATDYADCPDLLARLRFDAPKMGNNDPLADDLAVLLLDAFADAVDGLHNERGGIIRAGTGSAMYYLRHADNLPATADGRRAGEALAANYSPSLFARLKGPVSILQSFAKPNLGRVCNGGPLTLELHDTMLRNDQAVGKVAQLVKSYMDMGGHQLQLNAVNRDTLLAAKENPNAHRNLIVRVWGWSGYFVELDPEYQDHIISRTEHAV